VNDPRPAFLFYSRDFWSAEAVELMTAADVGVYLFLLCRQWETGSLPPDAAAVRRLCQRIAGADAADLERVLGQFPVDPDGRRRNPRLEFERKLADEQSQRQSARATTRWTRWRAEKQGSDANAMPRHSHGTAAAMPSEGIGIGMEKGREVQTPLTPLPGGDPAPQPAKRAPRRKPDEGWESVLARPEYARMSTHPTFARAWAVWIEHTGTAGAKARPPSALAAAAILNRALREGPDRFAAAVEASIAGNWQGIHYPDERRTSQAAGSAEQSLRILRQSALDLP
jgi:uncharacterized protein YdaU (DUF1376 family)